MDSKQTSVKKSRFHFQHVSASQRNQGAVTVDAGCQRCQHCTMVWRAAIVGHPISDENVPGRKLHKGVHPCL